MSEKSVLLGGQEPLSRNDEPDASAGNQPPVQAKASEASEKNPSDNDTGAVENEQDQSVVLEKRFKDTQRALSERDKRIESMQAQLEFLGKMVQSGGESKQTEQAKQQYSKRLEEIKQQSIENPGVIVDYVQELLQGQHQYITQLEQRVMGQVDSRLVESDPHYEEMRDAIGALDELGYSNMSPSEKVKIAGVMKKLYSSNSSGLDAEVLPRHGAPAGSQRKGTEAKKKPSNRELFGAYLQASGALKDDTPKGIVKFTTG